jgi:membrane-bound lytic murein transglycosylase A
VLKSLSIPFFLFLWSCSYSGKPSIVPTAFGPPMGVKRVEFNQILDWRVDNHAQAFDTFLRSCNRIIKKPAHTIMGINGFAGHASAWQDACYPALELRHGVSPDTARQFFENWFNPYKLSFNGQSQGLFTGYYEPQLRGSRHASDKYNVALYRRPPDLITANLGLFRSDWRGREVAGRIKGKRLVPYASRAVIDKGVLKGRRLELLWVDNAIDAFFLHIQGSGQVLMENGEIVRVAYAGRNGHPYYAIGRDLVKRGEITAQNISLQTIRAWLEEHPKQASTIMHKNKSYIFFRELKLSKRASKGPIGAAGVELTPGRSLAVDRKYFPMGAPMWLDSVHPLTKKPLRRLMVSQDTGGAITGPVRGDFFWGTGPGAGEAAGRMKNMGQLYILLPKRLKKKRNHQ